VVLSLLFFFFFFFFFVSGVYHLNLVVSVCYQLPVGCRIVVFSFVWMFGKACQVERGLE
jgi:hypothetical protein